MKLFSCSTELSMKFFLLINVKMPTIVGILTFISRKNSILGLSEPKKAEFLNIFILTSILNFMLNSVEHEKSFITSGPGQINIFRAILEKKLFVNNTVLYESSISRFRCSFDFKSLGFMEKNETMFVL